MNAGSLPKMSFVGLFRVYDVYITLFAIQYLAINDYWIKVSQTSFDNGKSYL
jgi:hypothetical protein